MRCELVSCPAVSRPALHSLVRFPQRKHPGSGSSTPLHSLRSIPLDSTYRPQHFFDPTEWPRLARFINERVKPPEALKSAAPDD